MRKKKKIYYYYKKSIFFLLLLAFYAINNNNNKIPIKLEFYSKNTINFLISLKKKDSLSEKEKIFHFLSKKYGKKISKIKTIFLTRNVRFGNMLIIIYRVLFFCKMIGCKRIILNKEKCWFIQNKINIPKKKLAIEFNDKKNINNSDVLIVDPYFFYAYRNKLIRPNYYIDLIRGEIFNNLPEVVINKNDLYIYIRSGDLFKSPAPKSAKCHAQPPLCFYTKILNHLTFSKVIIICEDNKNPVVRQLLKLYSYIQYQKRDLKSDVSYLINAYNIAGGGYSTFFNGIILLNKNLEKLWTFKYQKEPNRKKNNIEKLYDKNDKMPYIMYSSNDFMKKMYPWINSKEQRDLMINHTCLNHFIYNNEVIIY